ncbi:MAG: site-2 protease family protein [Elusimicrobiaceae bacterium]|nr:site-2 protease family protein [Elusimicrobiaceae bacterium]
MLLSIIAVLVVLSPIVIVHEFGHYLACRLTGIRVNEFSFGFGKILWHKKVGDTDYQVRAIPFGGFVEPAGPMFHPQDAPEPPKPYEFAAKKWYAKFFMVVNGALFNYLFAAVIFSALIYIKGAPETDPLLIKAEIGSVVKGYPAEQLSLQAGDIITRVNGQAVSNWKELTEALQNRQGDLSLTYRRENETKEVFLKANDFKAGEPTTLGITAPLEYKPVSLWEAIKFGPYQCYYWTKLSLTSLGSSFKQKKAPELAGPIGIVNIIHQAAHRNWTDFVFLIALLSVAVGMFNLFPIPILDGGYALVYLWEGLTNKLPTEKTLNVAVNCGLYLLILLVVYASYSDIKRIFFPVKAQTAITETTEQPTEEANHVQD